MRFRYILAGVAAFAALLSCSKKGGDEAEKVVILSIQAQMPEGVAADITSVDIVAEDMIQNIKKITDVSEIGINRIRISIEAIEEAGYKEMAHYNISYEDFNPQKDDVIYCDVPYESKNGKCEDYGLSFDSNKFYSWVKEQDSSSVMKYLTRASTR